MRLFLRILAVLMLLSPLLFWVHNTRAAGSTYYVATTGSDSNPCSLGSPCLTFDHAYHLADPGDTVLVRGGNYSQQNFSNKAGAVAPNIIFDEAPGEQVTLAGMNVGGYDNNVGADYVTFKNFSFVRTSDGDINAKIIDIENANGIVFDGITMDGGCSADGYIGGGVGLSGDNDDIKFLNSDIKCVRNGKLISSEKTAGDTTGNDNITFYNTKIHTMWRSPNDSDECQHLSEGCHNECWLATASAHVTLDRVHMYDCTVMNINAGCFGDGCETPGEDWHIVNSIMENPVDHGPTEPVQAPWIQGCPPTTPGFKNWVVEYNVLETDFIGGCSSGYAGMTMRGNIGRVQAHFSGCLDGVAYYNNIFMDVDADDDCINTAIGGDSNIRDDNILNNANFVDRPGHDWHIASSLSPQVDTGGFPTTLESEVIADKDGVSRPRGVAFDAGPYELESGLIGDINGDGTVDGDDVDRLLTHYRQPASSDAAADVNGDGKINIFDLSKVLFHYAP